MKYVILDKGYVEVPIVFSECQNHDEFKQMGNITGAGFVRISEEDGMKKAHVYGKSTSLNIEANPDDSFIIEQMLNKY